MLGVFGSHTEGNLQHRHVSHCFCARRDAAIFTSGLYQLLVRVRRRLSIPLVRLNPISFDSRLATAASACSVTLPTPLLCSGLLSQKGGARLKAKALREEGGGDSALDPHAMILVCDIPRVGILVR